MSGAKQLAFRVRDLVAVTSARLLGRTTAGTGRAEELTAAQVRGLLGVSTSAEVAAAYQPIGDYATLVGGLVPAGQLPSYVDDVIEGASLAAFPVTGESGKIYVALDTSRTYRWSGSAYVELTDSTAVWGSISGTLTNQTDLNSALAGKASTAHKSTHTVGGSDAFSAAEIRALLGVSTLSGSNTGDQDLSGLATTSSLTSGLAGKQDTLVSGTSIRTVNGNSLLGSGDVSISASVAPLVLGTNLVEQRNGTNAQIARWAKTYTSATSFEQFEIDAAGNATTFDLAAIIGSAGGTARGIRLGGKSAAGAFTSWLSFATTGAATFSNTVFVPTAIRMQRADLASGDVISQTGSSDTSIIAIGGGAVQIGNGGTSGNTLSSAGITTLQAVISSTTLPRVAWSSIPTVDVTTGSGQNRWVIQSRTNDNLFFGSRGGFEFLSGGGGGGSSGAIRLTINSAGDLDIYKTFTSATNNERLTIDPMTDASNFRIASRVGSAGGTQRGISIGAYNAAGTYTSWLDFATNGEILQSRNSNDNISSIRVRNSNAGSGAQTRIDLNNDAASGATAGASLFYCSTGWSGIYSRALGFWNFQNGPIVLATNNLERFVLAANGEAIFRGDLTIVPSASRTLATNGQFTIERTSDTAINLVYRGNDGTTRRLALTGFA